MARRRAYVVIMAGGQGTRFWPLSRRRTPKQLLAISGSRTMLQETVRRARTLAPPSHILVVTGTEHAAAVRRQVPTLPARNLIVEPRGRSTAACIGLAAATIAARDAEGFMVVLPSDHAVADRRRFQAAIRRALALAARYDLLVTLGVPPTRADTGFGYIQTGKPLDTRRPGAFEVVTFREKPGAAAAARYWRSGEYLWNAGMFVWSVARIQAELARHMPGLAAALAPVGAARTATGRAAAVRRAYAAIDSISIDHGVLEHAERRAVVRAEFGWSDVGSWDAMADLWGTDGDGNAVRGPVLAVDTRGTIAVGGKRLVALLGVTDLVVVDGGDALLVCHRSRAQDVRLISEVLRRRGLGRLT